MTKLIIVCTNRQNVRYASLPTVYRTFYSTDADGYCSIKRLLSHNITDLLIWFVIFFTSEIGIFEYNNAKKSSLQNCFHEAVILNCKTHKKTEKSLDKKRDENCEKCMEFRFIVQKILVFFRRQKDAKVRQSTFHI